MKKILLISLGSTSCKNCGWSPTVYLAKCLLVEQKDLACKIVRETMAAAQSF